MHPARLVILCGPPGGDITRRAERLAERFAATRMVPDDWAERLGVHISDADVRDRIANLQVDLTLDLLRRGTQVVIESGTSPRTERDYLRGRAIGVGALVHLDVLVAPSDSSWQRPTADEIAAYDPLPPVDAGDRPGSESFPYGSWLPQSRPR